MQEMDTARLMIEQAFNQPQRGRTPAETLRNYQDWLRAKPVKPEDLAYLEDLGIRLPENRLEYMRMICHLIELRGAVLYSHGEDRASAHRRAYMAALGLFTDTLDV